MASFLLGGFCSTKFSVWLWVYFVSQGRFHAKTAPEAVIALFFMVMDL